MSDKSGFSAAVGGSPSFGKVPHATEEKEKKTLVEEGTTLKGSVISNCPIIVRGRIEGDVGAPSLQVSASGSVHGKVKVTELRSAGELSGEFDADVVQLSGRVKDKTIIRGKSLEVRLVPQNGKMEVTFGECTLDIGDPPTKEDALKAAKEAKEAKEAAAKEAKEAAAKEAKEAKENKDAGRDVNKDTRETPAAVAPPSPGTPTPAAGAPADAKHDEDGKKHTRGSVPPKELKPS